MLLNLLAIIAGITIFPTAFSTEDTGGLNPNFDISTGHETTAMAKKKACIDRTWLTALAHGGRERKERGPFKTSNSLCHTQGSGYRYQDKRLIVTCQDFDGVARVFSFQSGSSKIFDQKNIKTASPVSRFSDNYLNHPSSTQIVDNYFPVAFANPSDKNGVMGSKLNMYTLGENGAITAMESAVSLINTGSSQSSPHIGTVGMLKREGDYLVLACDYNCRNIYKYSWNPIFNLWNYEGTIEPGKVNTTKWKDAKEWDAYNSLNIINSCEGNEIFLVGTKRNGSTHKIHVWQVLADSDFGPVRDLRVRNVAWRHFHSTKKYFREGTSLIPDPPRAHFITFGDDANLFGNFYAYEIWFYNKKEERHPTTNF